MKLIKRTLSVAPERNDYCLYVVDEFGATAAEVPCSNEDAHALATLFSLAPDLLKSLRTMLHMFDRELPQGSIGQIRCAEARALLAKMDGGD